MEQTTVGCEGTQQFVEFNKYISELRKAGGVQEPAMVTHERRAEPRFSFQSRGVADCPGRFLEEPIEVADISYRGVRFTIAQEITVGEPLILMVFLAGTAPRTAHIEARRVSRKESPEGVRYEVGGYIRCQQDCERCPSWRVVPHLEQAVAPEQPSAAVQGY